MKSFSKSLMVIMAVMLCVAFVGCAAPASDGGEDSSIAGSTWIISGVALTDGTEVTGADVNAIFGGEVKYTFNENGEGVVSVGGTDTAITYAENDGTVSVTVDGMTSEMVFDGDTLTYENEQGTCTLTRV